MGKSIINKHVETSELLKKEMFNEDVSKAKGEIIIVNDDNDPSVYILNNKEEIVKISANEDKINASISELQSGITEITNDVAGLTNDLSGLTDNVNALTDTIEFISGITKVTYQELVTLRGNSSLIPGHRYRIIDYQTIVRKTLTTTTAENVFDVIVEATSENTLSEDAKACLREGDTYFSYSDANLDAWELKYCLDNDRTRFDWTNTTNGKGVIYYMKDEWHNECPYDFKNIKYKVDDKWCYTFSHFESDDLIIDLSLSGISHNNVIKPYFNSKKYLLNNIMLISKHDKKITCGYNTFDINCKNITLGANCNRNTFGKICSNITLGSGCTYNTFGTGCNGITAIYVENDNNNETLLNNFDKNEFGANIESLIIKYIKKDDDDFDNTQTSKIQNYKFANSLTGEIILEDNDAFNRNYITNVAINSSGTIKQYCEADLIA